MNRVRLLLFALLLLPLISSAQVYPYFAPGGALSGGATSQNVNLNQSAFILGNLPQANTVSAAAQTIQGNATSGATANQALNPLAVANMISAVIAVNVVATSNLLLNGAATIDGVVLTGGEFVLADAQTTSSQNGIYVANLSGAWSRATNFPSGYIIQQNCLIVIEIRDGTVYSGRNFYVPTSSGPITIGTTGFTPTVVSQQASATRLGLVELAGGSGSAVEMNGIVATANDCAGFPTAGASTQAGVSDAGDANGNTGNCAVENPLTGHLVLNNNGNPGPTSSAGTINVKSTDHWGIITGLSGATTVTLTFAASFTNAPGCTANDNASPPTAIGVSTSATAVTFTMSALTGTLYYDCFGTN